MPPDLNNLSHQFIGTRPHLFPGYSTTVLLVARAMLPKEKVALAVPRTTSMEDLVRRFKSHGFPCQFTGQTLSGKIQGAPWEIIVLRPGLHGKGGR